MATTPNFSQPAIFSEVATPTVPDSGYLKVYAKSGTLYSIANGGTEKSYVAISGSGLPIGAYTLPTTDGTASQVLQTNGSGTVTWQTVSGGGGGGITSINGDTTAAQLLTVGTAGTDFAIDSVTTAGTSVFNIPDASATARGLVTTGTQTIAGTKTFTGLLSTTNEIQLNDSKAIYFGGSLSSPFVFGASGVVKVATSGFYSFTVGNRVIGLGSDASLSWSSTTDGAGTKDIHLLRDAAGTLAQRNSTSAQTFRVYNTYTSATSGEYGQLNWTSNEFRIGTAVGSAGGTQRGAVIGAWNSAGTWRGVLTVSPNSGSPVVDITPFWAPGFTVTAPGLASLTASTEYADINFNLSATKSWNAGTITTQRAFRIQAPTYAFASASTITTASTVSISGAPVAGTNATITNAYALNVESGRIGFTGGFGTGGIYFGGAGAYYAPHISSGSNQLVIAAQSQVDWIFSNSQYMQFYNGHISTNGSIQLGGATYNTGDINIIRDAAGVLATRNGTNAQSFGVYGTWTSTTSYERVNVRGKASANFEIGPENGSAGGTLRGFTIGGYSAGSSTITPWLSFTSSGTPTFDQGTVVIPSGGTGLLCQQTNIYLDSYGTHSGIRYRRSEGTQGSPTAVANNSLLGFFATYGYHGAGYHSTQGCAISFYATETYTAGAQGSKIVFGTTPNGTAVLATALTIDQNQVATFSKLVAQSAAEITSTPSGTTQTITLNNGNHQTLTLTSSTGAVTVTLTVPSNVSSGTIIVKQHGTTPRNITWAVSAGTIKWMGTQPTWSSDAANDIRIVSWRYDGSVMYLMSTDKAA